LGKLGVFSGQEICKILSKHGFAKIRQRGSHIIMQKNVGNSTITIPIPNHKEIARGTLQSIIRQSGLPREEFE
jgi:predicted RNA binding protein YcfA (HicA-like mRNA interferase family)